MNIINRLSDVQEYIEKVYEPSDEKTSDILREIDRQIESIKIDWENENE